MAATTTTAARCVRCGQRMAPRCARCKGRHRGGLPCWSNDRAHRALVTALVFAEYGDTCVHCGRRGADSVEHLVPRSHFGDDDLDNLRPAHLLCNQERACKPAPGHPATITTPTTSRRW